MSDGGPAVLEGTGTARRLMRSALCRDSPIMPMNRFFAWLVERAAAHACQVRRIPFAELTGWRFEPGTGNLVHETGRFFGIEGLQVRTEREWISSWTQPIIVQPEVGVLGILVKEFDGVLHCLMHAKMEPGNINTVQLSPTVQATRSNYTGVHQGRRTRYLDQLRPSARNRVLVDVLQSEQASWFLHKRNRNMVVETAEDVPVGDDYCWLTIGQLTQLLRWEDIVNMDTRTVLSCLPPDLTTAAGRIAPSSFGEALLRSFQHPGGELSSMAEVLSWLTEQRSRRELIQRRVPLAATEADGWHRSPTEIAHTSGKYFSVIAVDVQAGGREVAAWRQPLVAPVEPGLLALLVRPIGEVLHVLVQARVDAGSLNGAEMAPTVHCQPVNYRDLPADHQPPYLSYVLAADPAQVHYDVVQSEEGGRFFHAQNRYVVVEVGEDFPVEAPDEFRWMTLRQLASLLTHSNYLNVELRSLLACLRTLW